MTNYSYTKQDAVEDGSQVDISTLPITKEAGFKVPVYLTYGVFEIVKVPENLGDYQDFDGRLWDLLYMARLQFKTFKGDKHLILFKCIFEIARNKKKTYLFWLIFSESEGFTIMLPSEY